MREAAATGAGMCPPEPRHPPPKGPPVTTRQPRTAPTAHTATTARTARLLAAIAVLGGLLVGTAAPALAAAPDGTALRTAARAAAPATVSVSGTGRAAAAPDLAILSVGVEATRKTAKEAMAAQNTAAKALLDVLHKQGIEDRDIRTDSLSLSPVYTQSPEGRARSPGTRPGSPSP